MQRGGVRTIVLLCLLPALPSGARADDLEVGLENFLYRSSSSLLNRGNVLGLAPTENLMRLTSGVRVERGPFTARVAAFVERESGKNDESRVVARQAFVDYKSADGFLVRLGRQKTAWGSGFVWNPTARLEPPKSPANPSTERPGIDAVRLDISPSASASVTLVAGRARAGLTDLPGALAHDDDTSWTGALRSRLLIGGTDLAITFISGQKRHELWGIDVGRSFGAVAWHAESALYRGSEIDPGRSRDVFFRLAAGGLWTPGDSSVSFEYFFNGEGMNDATFAAYTTRLGRNLTSAQDPRVGEPQRALAFAAWSADAAIPFSSNLGLRRHYASLSYARREIAHETTLNLRAVVGLDDGGVILTPGVAYAPSGHIQMSFDVVLLAGPETAEYKLAPVRRAFQARVK